MSNKGRRAAFWLSILVGFWVTACGGGGGGGSTTPPPPSKTTPTVTVTPGSNSITAAQALTVTVAVSGTSGTPTGTVTLSSGTYASTAATLSSGSASITIPAGSLAAGTDTLTASYTPDANSSSSYYSSSGTAPVTVTLIIPAVTVSPASNSITTTQSLMVTIGVSGGAGSPTATGSITLSSGTYTSAATALVAGSASITVPAGALASGNDTLTASYTPDTNGSSTYKSASGSAPVTVTLITPTVTVSPGSNSITTAQALTVTVGVSGGGSNPTPTGTVTLSSGTYTSAATALTGGSVQINVPANSLALGTDTLTASYAPDANSSSIYNSASGTGSVTVTSPTPYTLTVNSAAPSSGISITVSPNDNNGAGSGTTPFTRTYYSGAQVTLSAALSDNGYSFVSWTGCTSNPTASNCDVTISGNTTVTATYNQSSITSITVTPTTPVTIGAQQQFTATVNGTGSYVKTVTWSVSAPSGSSLSPGDISATGLYNTPYPAPPTVTVTATSTSNTSISGSAIVTLNPPAAATGPALTVDLGTPGNPSENPHTISPYVYGMNAYLLDSASEKIANPGILRWGGDDTSRYNYQYNMTNSAADYYFENFQGAGGQFPNATGSTNFIQFVQSTDSAGPAALGTVPVLGWVANNTQYACGFPNSQFPGQQSYSPANCGNGVYPDGTNGCTASGGCDLYGNSTTQANTSIAEPAPSITTAPNPATASWADGTWPGGWVNSLVTNSSYGNGASGKGVAVWDLDNEPTWWDAVHRDVHPAPFTYDEVTNNGLGTALAIKTADPTALVSGPVIDNWWAYFYSKKDIEAGWVERPLLPAVERPHRPRGAWRRAHDRVLPAAIQQVFTELWLPPARLPGHPRLF